MPVTIRRRLRESKLVKLLLSGNGNRLLRACRRHLAPDRTLSAEHMPADQASSIRYFANPGPAFEERCTPELACTDARARTIAFYLPQFHAFPENDEWWGAGFTEWRNVARGTPRYQGHFQPRIPRDLGFYDLNNVDVLKKQSALAKAAGITGFCFYYYWFNGKRLMDRPLDLFAAHDIDQEFCIMWANENWTRRWDGRENDVLISQEYLDQDEDAFIEDTALYMEHPRYIRINKRPLFILYRPKLLPDAHQTIARWREKWSARLGESPLVFMAQTYAEFDPLPFGCDGAVEFPPHKVSRDIRRQNRHHTVFDPEFSGQIRAYDDIVDKSLNEPAPGFPLIKTVSPHWDNDARREGRGVSFQGSTPEAYSRWLDGAVRYAQSHPVADEAVVFINAWNEWAEAAYLEPDVHFGHAYLNATWRTLSAATSAAADASARKETLLLVGHDAHANGAQMLLLSLTRLLTEKFGLTVKVLLKRGGVLLPQYEALAETTVLDSLSPVLQAGYFRSSGCHYAIFNTTVTGDLLETARQERLTCVSLVHEMPSLITEFGLQAHARGIAEHANHVVFPSAAVQAGFQSFEPVIQGSVTLKPQGLYKLFSPVPGARESIRAQLGISADARLIINAGYADHRKGFDLFVQAAQRLSYSEPEMHFCWLGKRNRAMSRWLKSRVGKQLRGRLHLIDFTDDMASWYSAADCLFLASREDPFPSVVLEALSIGMPVVIHRDATGFDDGILSLARQADMAADENVDRMLRQAINEDSAELRHARQHHVREHYQLARYAMTLLRLTGMPLPVLLLEPSASTTASGDNRAADRLASNG